tara:strand:+ start:783 stop:1304 length:522 start_codon:yes stop_codon:yes gene_type:complete
MKGLVKTLVKPDWDDDPKRSEILNAANLLQVGEFQLIQLAYKVWYKNDLPEEKINKIFSQYMISGIIPIWVTYYAKDIIKMENANVLNSYDEKYHVYDHEFGAYLVDNKERKKRGIFYTFIIGIVFIASHYMAINYVQDEGSASFYPPYVEKRVVYPELYKDKTKDGNLKSKN